jgi:hypothetical protein
LIEERGGGFEPEPPSDPKLGSVTIVLPPLTETPGTAGVPLGLLPVPPGPTAGEMPPWALGSDPRPTPALAAPVPSPVMPLPGPFP